MPLIDGTHLTLDDIVAVARQGAPVTLDPSARERVAASQAYADEVASQRPIYGRSTGVGANRDGRAARAGLPGPAAAALPRHQLRSSGATAPRVRAMLVIRLNQLAADGNGIDPRVLDALTAMIVDDALPPVREGGSVGTADLAALATTALVLCGERVERPARAHARRPSGPATR